MRARFSVLVVAGCLVVPTLASVGTPAGPLRTLTDYLGNGVGGPILDNDYRPISVAMGEDGAAYFVSLSQPLDHNDQVFRARPGSGVEVFAGDGRNFREDGSIGDGDSAARGQLFSVAGLDFANGSLYIADTGHDRVRMVAPDGTISTIAGTTKGFAGDGELAVTAQLNQPVDIAVAPDGSVLIADSDNRRLRRVNTDGRIETVAGDGSTTNTGDGGPASEAGLQYPTDVTVDSIGNIFVLSGEIVRRIDATTGLIDTVAGRETSRPDGGYGDGGPADEARFLHAMGIAIDSGGRLLVTDGNSIRAVHHDGIIRTILGSNERPGTYFGDGGPASAAFVSYPIDISDDPSGGAVIADLDNHRIRRIDAAGITSSIEAVSPRCCSDDGLAAHEVALLFPHQMAQAADGTVFIADTGHDRIMAVSPEGIVRRVAGVGMPGYAGDGGPATAAHLNQPEAVAVDDRGTLLIADTGNHLVRRIDASGRISTFAGKYPLAGNPRPEGVAAETWIASPAALAIASSGDVYIAAGFPFNMILRVDSDGMMSVFAGDGEFGFFGSCSPDPSGADRLATTLCDPSGITLDEAGNVYFSERGWNVIRRVGADGIVRRVAGGFVCGNLIDISGVSLDLGEPPCDVPLAVGLDTFGSAGAGDGGPATLAKLTGPAQISFHEGVLYIADAGGRRIRAVDPDQRIRTVAGIGSGLYSEAGTPALLAGLQLPRGTLPLADGALLIAESIGFRVRAISLQEAL